MKVPFFWLKEYIPLSMSVDEVARILTLLGMEVESIDRAVCTFSGVVVGEVVTCAKHPHADRLQVATVTDGVETFQVVCGAANCRPGLKTAFAKIGAKLQDESGKSFTIKKSKLRDVESYGMLCAADELGLSSEAAGIMELPADAPLGRTLDEVLSEPILEVSLTPNLGHCLSMIGIARELSAYLKIPVQIPQGKPREDAQTLIEKNVQVSLEAPDVCSRYSCRYLLKVTVGPSPDWMKKRLEAAGIKSINNIVDIGNYVMLEMGQPLHMFDAAKIRGKKIIIRKADRDGEFTILDGSICKYPASALLICDTEGPLALAGVMGGLESGITNATIDIVIEAANFDSAAIRMASKKTGLRSESSYRFERGIDCGGVVKALDRAAELVCDIAGGVAAHGVIDVCPAGIHPRTITCRVNRVNRLLGLNLSRNEIVDLLVRLGMHIHGEDPEELRVTIPTYRNDLKIEVDLIEEVARLYGYNNIPRHLVKHISATFPDAPIYTFENTIREKLLREGLQEFLTCDLISPSQAELTEKQGIAKESLIRVLLPSSAEQSVLRPSLLPGLLQVIKLNQDHGTPDVAAYEVGKIHLQNAGKFHEQLMAGIVLCGKNAPFHFHPHPAAWDFFDLKGLIENLCENTHMPDLSFAPSHHAAFHPYRQAQLAVGAKTAGTLGELHPELLRTLGIKQRVFFAEINLHDLFSMRKPQASIEPLPQFPGTDRDWTLTLKEHTPIAALVSAIKSAAPPLLANFAIVGIYKSEQLGPDKKNASIRFFYRDPSQSISQEIVEKVHADLMQRVAQKIHDHLV